MTSDAGQGRATTLRPDGVCGEPLLVGFTSAGHVRDWPLAGTMSLGRLGSGADIEVPSGVVSSRHGEVSLVQGRVFYRDLGSTNGTWLDGCRVEDTVELREGSVLAFAPQNAPESPAFFVALASSAGKETDGVGETAAQAERERQDGPTPAFAEESSREAPEVVLGMDALKGSLVIDIEEKSVWSHHTKKVILRDVHLSVDPGEMVLILGGSGAGKSTFINAVMGNSKADGRIMLGDTDIYAEYERIKYEIGYVPQQDLLRGNDTVRDTLFAAAQLRMPKGTSHAECLARAVWAGELLGLKREGDTLVGRLSGGQRKRLSIAVELVSDPALFFLDEPDSGLDGVMARALMENLRSIADMGKMVLVITHGPDRAADLFSKVVVLAKVERDGAGHMVFCGSVANALEFFDTDSLEGVVRRINREDEGGDGLADRYLEKWEAR